MDRVGNFIKLMKTELNLDTYEKEDNHHLKRTFYGLKVLVNYDSLTMIYGDVTYDRCQYYWEDKWVLNKIIELVNKHYRVRISPTYLDLLYTQQISISNRICKIKGLSAEVFVYDISYMSRINMILILQRKVIRLLKKNVEDYKYEKLCTQVYKKCSTKNIKVRVDRLSHLINIKLGIDAKVEKYHNLYKITLSYDICIIVYHSSVALYRNDVLISVHVDWVEKDMIGLLKSISVIMEFHEVEIYKVEKRKVDELINNQHEIRKLIAVVFAGSDGVNNVIEDLYDALRNVEKDQLICIKLLDNAIKYNPSSDDVKKLEEEFERLKINREIKMNDTQLI
jgi:hypothetical protein